MARNRNRKRRGDDRTPDGAPPPSGLRTAGGMRAREKRIGSRVDDTSDPMGHSAPDAEIAEAQLAAGEARAERLEPAAGADAPEAAGSEVDASEPAGAGDDEPVLGPEVEIPGLTAGAPSPVPGEGGEVFPDEVTPEETEDDPEGAALARRPARRRNGVIGFAQGSWRELQRVQWPDQRQVVQATGVVIGFVIVAGAFLGLADWVATKIVHLILS